MLDLCNEISLPYNIDFARAVIYKHCMQYQFDNHIARCDSSCRNFAVSRSAVHSHSIV
jgi:hypothetical protein